MKLGPTCRPQGLASAVTAIVLSCLLMSTGARAATLDDLQASDDFRIRVFVQPDQQIVVTQEVSLVIELATTGWFAHGTSFELPEVDGAVVTQREQFGTNSTYRESGKTWAEQRWELSMFPHTEGELVVPSFAVSVNVSAPPHGIVQGAVETGELRFTADVPEPMRDLAQWRATPKLTVEQTWDKPLEELRPGDALKQTIHFKGEHLLAMMLPSYAQPQIDGLGVYPGLPQLLDYNSRGEKRGERVETIDYIIEANGRFEVPQQTFHWWNTESRQKETSSVPATVLSIGVASGSVEGPRQSTQDDNVSRDLFRISLAAIIPIGFLLAVLYIKRRRSTSTETRQLTRRTIRTHIQQATRNGDPAELARWLYIWMDRLEPVRTSVLLREHAGLTGDSDFVRQVNGVLEGAFASHPQTGTHLVGLPGGRSKGLIKRIRDLAPAKVRLQLNP